MTNIFIIHGAYGHPGENWFPWLKKELEKLGCKVFMPKFPTPEGQNLENWLEVMKNYGQNIDKNTIFVGHSIGCAFILSLLEETQAKAAFLVSAFAGFLGNPQFDELNKTFVDRPFDWKQIKKNCKKLRLFHSDNDPYVPLEKAEEIAKNLGVKVLVVKGAGHFNEKAGYLEFDSLLNKIKKEL